MKSLFKNYFHLLRPQQWLKNSFIWVGVLFGQAWTNIPIVTQVLIATLAFCLLSSSAYIINDIFDYTLDKSHPEKKHRPIPAGKIKISTALTIAIGLGIFAITAGFYLSIKIGIIFLTYNLLNILYSWRLKRIIILDVFIIATGFILRILTGTYGVGIPPSHWLLICSLLLTLLLGFSKRRCDYRLLKDKKTSHHTVLPHYNLTLLDTLIAICASGTAISYSLYTVSPETAQAHPASALIYTIPLVLYGLFRYLYLLYANKLISGQDIAKEIFHDKHLLIVMLSWFLLTIYLL